MRSKHQIVEYADSITSLLAKYFCFSCLSVLYIIVYPHLESSLVHGRHLIFTQLMCK